jgi:uncharacterized protein YbbC (DUF1343 family)
MIQVGLDRLLDAVEVLQGRRFGLVAHSASVSADMVPIQLALARAGAPLPVKMFGPEHGFFGVEQDMVPSSDSVDPWIGAPIVSLYGDSEDSLRPDRSAFSGLDLVLVDLQDVGARYYTYAATAIWSAAAALAEGCEVWVLDRPNPLGGERIEGNIRQQGFESFVGAFETPVRHGLTLAEVMRWQLSREGADISGLKEWKMAGWRREMSWRSTGRRWVAPSPNLPTPRVARVYPGACLIEATCASEGRGTTRPFELIGSPTVQPVDLADRLNAADLSGARFVPTYFRPQYHKHAGEVCGGVQWIVEDSAALEPYRCGVEIVRALVASDPEFAWRAEPYEFVDDIPAIDLLAGTSALRRSLEEGADLDAWLASWREDERRFREETLPFLLYPSERDRSGDF